MLHLPAPKAGPLVACLTAVVWGAVVACSPTNTEPKASLDDDEIRKSAIDLYRAKLTTETDATERAELERRLARLERGESVLDRDETLRALGYKVTETKREQQTYRSTAHGYSVTMPSGIELQEHRNGQFVIVPTHGTLFGIWVHAETSRDDVEAKLLSDFERWCGEHPGSAEERRRNGGSLRLVPVTHGPFAGYKAVAKNLPDAAPARFYAFKSPRKDGYFGFNLTPSLAGVLVESLKPLTAAPPGGK